MNKLKYILLFASATFLMALSACSSDDNIATAPGVEGNTEDGAPAELKVSLATMSGATSRTLSATNENVVNDLALLAFNDRGNCNGFSYTRSASAGTTLTSANVKTRQGDNITIFAVANVDGTTCDSAVLSKIETIAEFKKCTIRMSNPSDLMSGDDIPMFGSTTIASLNLATGNANIDLTRLATKLTFTIKCDSGVALAKCQLCHIPMASYVWQQSPYVKGNAYEYNPGMVYNNLPHMDFLPILQNEDPNNTKDTTVVFYTFENYAGLNSTITTSADRTWDNAPSNATYLTVTAAINKWDGGVATPTEVPVRMYLGGITSTDYDNFDMPRSYEYQGIIRICYSAVNNTTLLLPTLVTNDNTVNNWNTVSTEPSDMYNY